MPPIAELAQPELKLAGLRLCPAAYSRSRMSYYTALAWAPFTDAVVLPLGAGQGQCLALPKGSWINYVRWSEDSRRVAFTLRPSADSDVPRRPLELWVADTATGAARKVLDGLNTVFEE